MGGEPTRTVTQDEVPHDRVTTGEMTPRAKIIQHPTLEKASLRLTRSLQWEHVEVSLVRKALLSAMERSRLHAQERRQRVAEAEDTYRKFLELKAVPVARQLGQALKAEGFPFTVFTPSGGLRLASDHGRDDYIELQLDTTGDLPQVLGRVHRVRGSRTLASERPIRPGTDIAMLSEDDALAFFVEALEPWLER